MDFRIGTLGMECYNSSIRHDTLGQAYKTWDITIEVLSI